MFLDHLFRTKDNGKFVPIQDVPWMMGLRAMPAPAEAWYERAFVYTGATNTTYTRGVVYQCTRTGAGTEGDPYVYAWTASRVTNVANGLLVLNGSGKVDAAYLPSYVDDVIEAYYFEGAFYEEAGHVTEITPESGKIYVDIDTATGYRWSGSVYVAIAASGAAELAMLIEKTGYGVYSGMEIAPQDTPDMTYKCSAGIFYKADGTRQDVVQILSQAVNTADDVKDRIDLAWLDADGMVQYLAGTIEVDAVAGARTLTVTVNAVEDDEITIEGEVLKAIVIALGTDEFTIGATTILTATALYNIINSNATLSALFTATNPSDNVVTLTEDTPGGGNTPGEMTPTGDILITNGEATESAAAVKGQRDIVITDRAEENDTLVLDSQTFTCINGTPGTDQFEEAGTIAQTAINLAAAIAANATLGDLYNVTLPTPGTIRLEEKSAGGGNTPGAATPTGTLAVTNDDPITSAAAVAGSRSYTVTNNASHKDTIGLDSETFTARKAAAGTDEFVPGAGVTETATLLYNLINANAALSAKYTATNPSAGVVVITETTPGGGDTPGAAAVDGTIEITNGEPTVSVAHVDGGTVPDTPAGGAALAEIDVDHGQTTIEAGDITKKRVWTVPGVND